MIDFSLIKKKIKAIVECHTCLDEGLGEEKEVNHLADCLFYFVHEIEALKKKKNIRILIIHLSMSLAIVSLSLK